MHFFTFVINDSIIHIAFLQALCFGAWKGYVHVVKILLENGGNPDMTTFDGQRPCDLAFSQGYKTVGTMFFVMLMQHLIPANRNFK